MIRTRLTILNCAVLAFVLAAVGVSIYVTAKQRLYGEVDDELNDRAGYFAQSWASGPKSPGYAPPPLPPPMPAEKARREGIDPQQLNRFHALADSLLPMVVNLKGQDIFMRGRLLWDERGYRLAVSGEMAYGKGAQNGLPLRVISVPLYQSGRIFAVAQLATPVDAVEDELSQLAKTLAIVFPLAILVMLFTGVVLTKRALQPVSDIARAADQIGAASLAGRLPVEGSDEFARLSSTFNRMLDRLESAFRAKDEAYARQLRFTADASHELKTPLAAIRARVGLALSRHAKPEQGTEHMQAIDRASRIMSAIVKDLLLLAKADEGRLDLVCKSVAMHELMQDALAAVDLSDRMVQVDIDPQLYISVDSAAMTRVFVNLIENAVRHTRKRGNIEILARLGERQVQVQITDDGEGIPPEHQELVFNRFHRVDKSRDRSSGGSGLGLAIAKGIVEAHDGRIELESDPDSGTRVSVILPIAP